MNRALSVDFLRTFVAIADAGTFAAAAERVGRTVSAVSLQIDAPSARGTRRACAPRACPEARLKLRRSSSAVATSREGHLSGFHPVAPHAPECLGAFVIWTDFKCPTRSTLQIRCRRTALRARRSRIRANADYRKA